MANYSSHRWLRFLIGTLFLVSAAHSLSAQNKQIIKDRELINARSAYIDGLAAFENENYRKALDLLTAAYVKLPDHPGINFALADAYFMINDYDNAEYYAKQAVKLNPQNRWYYLKLSRIYRQAGKSEAAINELNTALEFHPNNTELLFELAQIYSNTGRLLQANKIYNKLLHLRGENISIRLKKLQHFNSLDMKDSAITELQKIRAHDPGNLSTLQVLSKHYLEINRLEEAKEVLRNALEIKEHDPKTLIMLSEIYLKEHNWEKAHTLLETAITDTSVSEQEKITIARQFYSKFNADTDNAELRKITDTLLRKLMRDHPKSSQIQALAADFFTQTNQTGPALQALERTTTLTPTNDSAWRQHLQVLLMAGQTEKAIAVGKQAVKEIPQDPIILYLVGSAHLSNRQPGEAVGYLQKAIDLPVRRALKGNILASLGNAYAALDRWEESFKNYEASLEINPENVVVLNNYAYYLSLQKQQLQKAAKMARKALELDPDNPSYLDTVGWIYYQKGAYEKAEKYIRRSMEAGRASAEVMEHLGDVLHKLDKPREAKAWWRKAFEKDSTRTHLKDKISTQRE